MTENVRCLTIRLWRPTRTIHFTKTLYFQRPFISFFRIVFFYKMIKNTQKNFLTWWSWDFELWKIGLLKFHKRWSNKLRIYLRHACIYSKWGLNQKRMNFVSVHNLFSIWFWILAFITFSEPAVRTWSLFDQLSKSKLTFSFAIKPSTVNLELFFYSEAQGLALISTVWVCRRVKILITVVLHTISHYLWEWNLEEPDDKFISEYKRAWGKWK